MTTTAIIERGADGSYGIYTPDLQNTISGNGGTLSEARSDFLQAYGEAVSVFEEAGLPVPDELRGLEFVYRYDVAAFFEAFPWVNIGAAAETMGINPSLMRAYKRGAYISAARKKAIEDGLHRLGEQLCGVAIG